MQSKTEYISFLKKSENEKNEIGMIKLLNLGIKHLCIIYNGDFKNKDWKNKFLFVFNWMKQQTLRNN